jgi:hypothetical protein
LAGEETGRQIFTVSPFNTSAIHKGG